MTAPLPAVAALAAGLALPLQAAAEALDCQVTTDCTGLPRCTPETLRIAFAIDRRQFAPAFDANEPPRVKRTRVTAGGAVFVAEPFLIGDGAIRGFWEDAEAMGSRMLSVTPDGAATYSETHTGLTYTGRCEER